MNLTEYHLIQNITQQIQTYLLNTRIMSNKAILVIFKAKGSILIAQIQELIIQEHRFQVRINLSHIPIIVGVFRDKILSHIKVNLVG